MVAEYIEKKNLAKLGYRFDGDKLDCFKAECFSVIADQIAKSEKAEMDKQKSKMRSKGGRRKR